MTLASRCVYHQQLQPESGIRAVSKRSLISQYCSELLNLHAVDEVDEGGLFITFLVVADAHSTVHVVLLTAEELHLVAFAHDELDGSSGALLEDWDSFFFALFSKMSNNLGKVALGPCGEVRLLELDLVKLEGINNIDDLGGINILLNDIVGSDSDLVATLADHAGLNLDAGILVARCHGVGVRDEFITGDNAFVNSNHSDVGVQKL